MKPTGKICNQRIRVVKRIKVMNNTHKTHIPTFTGSIALGLNEGYSQKKYTKKEVIKAIQEYQHERIKAENIYLSARVTECEIVLSGQVEPHLQLDFINYPRFAMKAKDLKKEILNLS
jgi:hypothetical protein